MQISATIPLSPVAAVNRYATNAQQQAEATAKPAATKVWTPAPPLRPNVQDYVDIDRTLIALRRL